MTAQPTTPSRESAKLDAAAWTDAGLSVLAESGVAAVRVEPLARRLAVTKGSFYWHFKDRADLLAAMLTSWRRQATSRIIERIERSQRAPLEKLRQLIDLPVLGKNSARGASLELAIRLWAKSDASAAEAIVEIDQQRLAHIAGLLKAAGVQDDAEAEGRAFLYYAYMLAEAFITPPLSAQAKQVCDAQLAAPSPRASARQAERVAAVRAAP
jgi:AcrR family transcriptional regulator